jgi:hypothetical protein
MQPTDEMIIAALNHLKSGGSGVVSFGSPKEGEPQVNYIKNPYKGYVASFGGSIVQIGLLGTILTYETDKDRDPCKANVINCLFAIYNMVFPDSPVHLNRFKDDYERLDKRKFRNRICKVAVALKLAMRTYHFDETESLD